MKYSLILAFMLISIPAHAHPSWQQSQADQVQLGVRDKYGELKDYEAIFVVTYQGKEYKFKKTVKDDNFAFAYFPQDFNSVLSPGEYKWRCIVKDKNIANGNFNVPSNDAILLEDGTKLNGQ